MALYTTWLKSLTGRRDIDDNGARVLFRTDATPLPDPRPYGSAAIICDFHSGTIRLASFTSALSATWEDVKSGGFATSARLATSAISAVHATSATIADSAIHAGSATFATSAGHANSATAADSAAWAVSARYATSALSANHAASAIFATSAGHANSATAADSAAFAVVASHAATASGIWDGADSATGPEIFSAISGQNNHIHNALRLRPHAIVTGNSLLTTSAQWWPFNPTSNLQVSFPAASTVSGYQWDVTNIGTSELSAIAPAGDTIIAQGSSVVLSAQGDSISLRSLGSNAYLLV